MHSYSIINKHTRALTMEWAYFGIFAVVSFFLYYLGYRFYLTRQIDKALNQPFLLLLFKQPGVNQSIKIEMTSVCSSAECLFFNDSGVHKKIMSIANRDVLCSTLVLYTLAYAHDLAENGYKIMLNDSTLIHYGVIGDVLTKLILQNQILTSTEKSNLLITMASSMPPEALQKLNGLYQSLDS